MMQISKKQHSELLDALNFPKKGEVLGGKPVLSASAKLSGDVLTYEVEFPKGTKTKEIPSLLKHFFSTQVIPTETNMVVKHHDYRVHPKNGNVCVSGAMSIGEVVRSNPTMLEFDQEYADMEMTNPETYFKKHDYSTFNSPQFRAKLFGFVSYMGENYGYCDDKCIYHRRASLIMPKIKITKAVPKAKMMYHTHPKKDEPSLSSADDYLIYMDLSHEPRGIRHFYTVMEDRMDHFQITPKKDSKSKFVQLSEDKIIEEIDTKITDLEHKWNEKIPKEKSSKEDDLRYCENVTRDLVSWMNKKYGKYFTFKYNCYYRVKKNPPEPSADDLHLNDEFLQKAIADIRTRTYSWPEFESKKMPHELYAYWHQMYYKKFAQSSSMTLGVNLAPANQRRYDQYMSKKFEDTLYSNLDALYVLNLAYDVAAQDAKVRDGNEFASRIEELCKYLGISDQACETLTLLEQVIHQQDVFSEEAKTMAGDYYPLVLLSFYSISAINTIEKVKEGKLDPDLAKYEVYAKLKSQVGGELESFLITKERLPYNGFVDSYLNPPPMVLKRTDYEVTFPPEAFDFYDIVVEALSQYSKSLVDPTREFHKLGKFNLSVPTSGGRVGMMITQSTGKAQVFATNTKNPMEDAMEAVDKVGQALYRAGLPVDPKEFNLTFDEPATNPQIAQVIAICGPSGSGKSTTIRTLLKHLPNSRTSATVTTRRKRKSDKPGEKEHLSKGEFLHLVERGELVAVQLQKGGDYYGRRRSDFEKEGYVIIDVSLSGYDQIKKIFPNTFGVYLEPVEDPETIRKRLLLRGDMSAKDARGRVSIIPQHIQDSKSRNFDLRIQTKSGEFDYAAKEILDTLPRVNPQETLPPELTEGAAVSPIPATEWFKKPLVPSPQERPEDTSTQSSLFEYFEEDENEDQELEEAIEEIPENPKRSNKKELFDWFEEWVHLVNMKNKELEAFLDSDWGKVAGLSKQEAKDWNNIKSGRVSGRRILSMRKKIGLTGPKDYIDPNKPRILEDYYEKALNNWTGPSDDAMKGETDWDWCKRQVRFNKRASAFPYNPTAEEHKGPLVKEFKTYNRPSRRLLSLWVWGHDPWRWARKHGMEKMSPCPDVPWIGMTEKRKWGKVEVEMSPRKMNPRIPKKYEGQDPSEHSDLYTDEDPKGTIQGLGFKDKETAERSVNIIKRSGKTHAHKIQAAMAMEQRARFHPNATPGIKAAQKVYAKFIEEMKEKTKRNPKKTPEGRKIPKRYLKGLNKEEMIIAAKEIDKGYKYDINDPKAYEFWKSDIKATARGYETVPSKYKTKFVEMYGPLPKEGDFITKISKATGVRKPILQKVYDKGLAAWRGGHRPGVQQHQWAAGRVYSFVTLGNTVKKGNKKMPDYSLAVEAGLIKDNPSEADFFPGDTHSFSPYATAQTIPITALQNPNIKDSEIHGQGLFADENISRGEIVVTDTSDVKYINHSDSPNLTARYLPDETLEYVAKANIKQGSELTLDYRQLAKLTGHPAANEEVQPETLFNPSEWRHGEFAEEDPFEEYF
jgi:guanylate kinase